MKDDTTGVKPPLALVAPGDADEALAAKNRRALAASLVHMRTNLGIIIEYHALNAKVMRAKFKSLVDEGFTPEQALEIVKQVAQ